MCKMLLLLLPFISVLTSLSSAEGLFDETSSSYTVDYRYNKRVRRVHRKHRHKVALQYT